MVFDNMIYIYKISNFKFKLNVCILLLKYINVDFWENRLVFNRLSDNLKEEILTSVSISLVRNNFRKHKSCLFRYLLFFEQKIQLLEKKLENIKSFKMRPAFHKKSFKDAMTNSKFMYVNGKLFQKIT